jgi:lipid II:glycine glycyltransferase (peptidoglycan interpeptide bridge formation enzyme)
LEIPSLQSLVQMIDLRQTKKYGNFLQEIGWEVVHLKIANRPLQIFIKKLPFLPFSFIKIQRPQTINFKKIKKIFFKHKTLIVKIEPDLFLNDGKNQIKDQKKFFENSGFKQDKHGLLPSKTTWINLKKDEEYLLKQIKKDARYCLKQALKNSIQIIKSKNLETFHQLLRQNCRLGRLFAYPLSHLKILKKTLKKDFLLFLAHDNFKKPLSGAVILFSPEVAYYYLAATSKEGRKLLAQYLILWEAIKEAKKAGKEIFDLEGIYDERFPQKSWLGFSHFKKSFGGQEIEYPGCFTKLFFF